MTNKDNIKILITGGGGYVGSNLVDFFDKSGALVYPAVTKPAGDRKKLNWISGKRRKWRKLFEKSPRILLFIQPL